MTSLPDPTTIQQDDCPPRKSCPICREILADYDASLKRAHAVIVKATTLLQELPSNSQRIKHDATPAKPANLFDEPFETWWRNHTTLIDTAMALGTRDAWKHIVCVAFVGGAVVDWHHIIADPTGPADEPGDDSDETNVDRGRSC